MKNNHKEIICHFIEEVFNKGNLKALNEVIHEDYHYQSPTETMTGINELRAFVKTLRSAFPDLHIKIDAQIAESEIVGTRITMSGTHQGEFLGLPATESPVKIQGVIISKLEEGLIREEWELLDQLTLLQQLGIAESAQEDLTEKIIQQRRTLPN